MPTTHDRRCQTPSVGSAASKPDCAPVRDCIHQQLEEFVRCQLEDDRPARVVLAAELVTPFVRDSGCGVRLVGQRDDRTLVEDAVEYPSQVALAFALDPCVVVITFGSIAIVISPERMFACGVTFKNTPVSTRSASSMICHISC